MASEIDEIYSKISGFLSRGPALTVDIAEYMGKDTSQTSAILDYYVSRGDIGRVERRYGTSAIYYLKKDLDAALNRLYLTLNGNEKNLINKIKSAGVVKSEDLAPAERYISKSLTDFIKTVSTQDSETGEKVDYLYYYQLSLDNVSEIINASVQKPQKRVEKNAAQTETKRPAAPRKTKLIESMTPELKNMLFGYGFSGVDKIEPDIYYCDYGQNRLKVVVIVAKKNSLTKKDFIKFAGYAESYKTICFVLTTAKKIEDYSKYGNVINVLRIN